MIPTELNLNIRVPENSSEELKGLARRIDKESKERNQYEIFRGAFGDGENGAGLIENSIYPPEGGVLCKLYGCKFLFKGRPMNDVLEGLSFGKSLISRIPREIIARSPYLMLALGLLFLFGRKRFINYARIYSQVIVYNIARQRFTRQQYNAPVRELDRAVRAVIERQYGTSESLLDEKVRKSDLGEIILNMSEFIFMFLEYDCAYRFRLQDIIEELDKERLKHDVVGEIARLFDILMAREVSSEGEGIYHKWVRMRKIILPILKLSKKARSFVKDFLLEVDVEKVSLDDADWYFCLDRHYQYRGVSHDARMVERKDIDVLAGNVNVFVTDKKSDGYVDVT